MNDWVYEKYQEFYNKHGYIPKMFNPYNCAEITDVAPCISTACGVITTSAAVLIVESEVLNDGTNRQTSIITQVISV